MRTVFAPEAARDLDLAIEFVNERNPVAAAELLDRVKNLLHRLAEGEFEGPAQRLRTGEWVRSWPIPPYRLYYRRSDDLLEVVRVFHMARRPISGR